MRPWVLAIVVGLVGCATAPAGGRSVQRFTGYPYDITDDGSRIAGLVCGVSVDYSVERHGDVTAVSGFGGGSVSIQVREQGDQRLISGSIGHSVARGQLDLTVSPQAVTGRVGVRDVDLRGVDDDYRGKYSVRNELGSAPMVVEGRREISQLPPAELAALMPAMLNCEGPVGKPVMHGPVAIRFGGPPGYETRAANELR